MGAHPRAAVLYAGDVTDEPRPGDTLVRVGAGVFALGLVGVLLVVVPFFLGHGEAPLPLDLLALLLPVGFGLALLGLLRGTRHPQQVHGPAPELPHLDRDEPLPPYDEG